ncbi:MAG: polyribonucleotide nucleotidyltransferase [Microgenomates group bacterium]
MNIIEDSIEINGQKLTFQFGKLAKLADASVFARLGDTCVLVTVTVGQEKKEMDYLPLTVEYVEKLYAGGRIKGSRWVKREGRPNDEAILNARLIDRSIRPLINQNFRKDLQIIITLLSVDGINSPEILAAMATSLALNISSVAWNGPISTIRIGYLKNNGAGNFIINPTENEMEYSSLDLVVSSTEEKVVMIETKADNLPEELIIKGIQLAKQENKKIIDFIKKLSAKTKIQKEKIGESIYDEKLIQILKKDFKKNLDRLILQKAEKEFSDGEELQVIVSEVMEKYKDEYGLNEVIKTIDYLTKKLIKEYVLKNKKRIDGRKLDELRKISVEVGVLPRTHGSAIFQRGDTQVLSVVTLGAPNLEQLIESPEGEEAKRYIHHYYMPPYSVGETGRLGWPSRREIGHGALAEKAIEPVLPSEKDFPYTIRVVSEVLSSNGSTSMASTCGSSLALMDAGVPIKKQVAGIAMGLMSQNDDDFVILTDIAGVEDFSGEMDFKIAGTEEGVTAIQLDVKNLGLTDKMIEATFKQAKEARLQILEKMNEVISSPRKQVSDFAPKVVVLTPPIEKIGDIIGPGGKNIRALIAKTGVDINISDDGKVTISGVNRKNVEEAKAVIEGITREIQIGETFIAVVKKLLPFGAIVEFLPGKEGLIHVSKMGRGFVRDPGKILKIGQKVKVRVYQIDNQGRINLEMLR